ncbi:centrosomal protein POC5 isoform X1 [Xiphophorus hellerii]|uniref:centrosomal protein POC5 isoform X1 n=2 Tax=Xiphophorus hellerii TaxID=8084 RepID=UPI0013B46BD4|nr:centrosomal protein POC5 isoform X1 [Xiphophorus hellerii]
MIQMSSEEDEDSPVLPKDSDRGSSVSSELQDEYEELFRYAVITPKHDLLTVGQGQSSQRTDEPSGQHLQEPEADERLSIRSIRLSQAFSQAERTAGPSSSKTSVRSNAPSEDFQAASKSSDNQESHDCAFTEMFISDENLSKMENILDTWSHNLKSNVLTELQKWKYAFMERHRMEMKKEGEKHAVQMAGLKSELDTLKGLLRTYETSNQRKDEVIRNLSQVLERQKEKQEKMKTFTHWRLQHAEAKEEAHAVQVARQHYSLQLKRKVWQGWHGLVQKRWKTKVERACRSRAEEVCSHLSAEYEAKLAEQSEALDKSEAEIQRLHFERERYEESMKKAFMRGVCALNMEALNMFQSTETRTEQLSTQEPHDPSPGQDERGSATLPKHQPFPTTSKRFSPVHFERLEPTQREADDMVGPRASTSQEEMLPFTTVLHSSLPLGGIASTHKQSGARIVTAGQQKSSKTVTARITARSDVGKVPHGGLQVMGVAPPMSSVVVERHHPITQLTVGQALASKFPRPLQQSHTSAVGRASSRTHTSTCSVHSIKEVE